MGTGGPLVPLDELCLGNALAGVSLSLPCQCRAYLRARANRLPDLRCGRRPAPREVPSRRLPGSPGTGGLGQARAARFSAVSARLPNLRGPPVPATEPER